METREQREVLLKSAISQFLDHLDDDWDGEGEFGAIVIAVELYQGEDGQDVNPTYWCSNESAIWQRGFFECLVDLKRLDNQADPEDEA